MRFAKRPLKSKYLSWIFLVRRFQGICQDSMWRASAGTPEEFIQNQSTQLCNLWPFTIEQVLDQKSKF